MKREYHCWWSPRLHRDMELLIFGHAGAKVLVFPTRFARFYEYENLRIVDSIRDKIEGGHDPHVHSVKSMPPPQHCSKIPLV